MGYFVKKMDDFGKKGSWTRKVFADFIDEYQQVTFLCCRTLGLNETEAEDVASETFLAAYKKLDKFRGQSKLSTWIWKIPITSQSITSGKTGVICGSLMKLMTSWLIRKLLRWRRNLKTKSMLRSYGIRSGAFRVTGRSRSCCITDRIKVSVKFLKLWESGKIPLKRIFSEDEKN
jgi:hypothetical protein